jgi:hypothetical protein
LHGDYSFVDLAAIGVFPARRKFRGCFHVTQYFPPASL